MITLIFDYMNDKVIITINRNDIRFGTTSQGAMTATIEGIKLDYAGVCREFPELETRHDWREEAIKRFKMKIQEFKTDNEKAEFIIEDLRKHGYIPQFKQKSGWRMERIK